MSLKLFRFPLLQIIKKYFTTKCFLMHQLYLNVIRLLIRCYLLKNMVISTLDQSNGLNDRLLKKKKKQMT